MAETAFVFGTQWRGRCFVCGASYPRYHTDDRLCSQCVDRYRKHGFFRDVFDLKACFVTILPEAIGIPERALQRGFTDLFLGSGEADSDPLRLSEEKTFPRDPQLPCGRPVLFEADPLARFSGFKHAWILDMSPYLWSGTLKDLKSWAVLSVALEHNIRHLALWTAGNAGLSLAKLVHRWNVAQQDEQKRRIVHCLVDTMVPPEVVVGLRSLQCRVAPISTGAGAVLSREQLYNVVVSLVDGVDSYWQVTDGWDGVGVFMYSLLARQTIFWLRA